MRTFFSRLKVNSSYFLFWITYFVLARLIFISYYFEKTTEVSFTDILKSFLYGFRLDLSFSGYLSLLPFLFLVLSIFIPKKIIQSGIKVITFFFIFFITFWFLIDLKMYSHWGNRLDSTILMHAKTPKIMLASVSNNQLYGGLFLWVLLSLIICWGYTKIVNPAFKNLSQGKIWEAPIFLLIFGLLILPIRGGLQTIPINQSNVYFSKSMFANHTALNFAWNFANTLTHKTDGKNPYSLFNEKLATSIIEKRLNPLRSRINDTLLNTQKPNILLIIWEGLSAKAVGSLKGEFNATPNLNRFTKEGILFTNFYGNGERTDKGVPAILSGFYPQPKTSIIKMVHKSRKLPLLSSEMKKMGYYNSFYYGGDMNFGNLNTYIRNGNIDLIVDGSEFDDKDWNSKWGAYDHVVLSKLQKDLSKKTEPFFTTILTLTSHEPFELPSDEFKFGKNNNQNKYLSSQYYTDEAIGTFIKEAKKQSWWKNTLVILVADHGNTLPADKGYFNQPSRFKIPMLWMGGALNKKGIVIDNFSSQVDISYTLLNLFNVNTKSFPFGKNIFDTSKQQFAHYIFNNGFGIIDKNGAYVYDYIARKVAFKTGNTAQLDSLGKAITQNAYKSFLDK